MHVITLGRSVRVLALDEVGVVTKIRPHAAGQIFEVTLSGSRRIDCRRHEISEINGEAWCSAEVPDKRTWGPWGDDFCG